MRSQLPTLELDAVFEAKEELALAVKNALATVMSGYGYSIIQALITDLDPDVRTCKSLKFLCSYSRRTSYSHYCSTCALSLYRSRQEMKGAVQVLSCIHRVVSTHFMIVHSFSYDATLQVKAAMNEINSSKRLKFAVAERAEGEKILEVKRAEVCTVPYPNGLPITLA